MSNTCGWVNPDGNFQQVLDVICAAMQGWCQGLDWADPGISTIFDVAEQTSVQVRDQQTSVTTIAGNVSAIKATVNHVDYGNAALESLLLAINSQLSDVETDTSDIGTAFTKSGGGAVYPTPNAHNIAEDFVNTRTAVAVIDTVETLLQLRFGGGAIALGNTLQNAAMDFLDHSGVQVKISADIGLQQAGAVPPLTSLTHSDLHAITNGAVVDIPNYVYGLLIDLTVPSGRPGRGSNPKQFMPALGRIAYAYTGYWLVDPIPLQVAQLIAYPLHPSANQFSINLTAGISGIYGFLSM